MKALALFSGFGGVDIGLKQAGISDILGIEIDDEIAAVARSNGFDTMTADVTKIDYSQLGDFDIMHASPPCPSFSVAKTDAEETEQDIALATAVANSIRTIRPAFFTLENVYLYRKSQSWRIIRQALIDGGYGFTYWHLNAADYGVPQTRKRMIVVARRDGKRPRKPKATHIDHISLGNQIALFAPLPRWIGWYTAIEDLIPTLPDSKFPPWQLERLPEWAYTFVMNGAGNTNFEEAYPGRGRISAHEPITTLAAGGNGGRTVRAFLLNTHSGTGNEVGIALPRQPSFTQLAQKAGRLRAFVADGQPNSSGETVAVRDESEPCFTLAASGTKRTSRAWLAHGRVVKLTPRAIARLQSFPDWYELPERAVLAVKGLGNAVPPLMYRRIVEALV